MMKKMNDIKAKSGKVPTCANPACPGLAAVGWVQFAGGELKPAAEQDMMSGLATDDDLHEGGSSKRPASPPGRDGYGSPHKQEAGHQLGRISLRPQQGRVRRRLPSPL